MFADGRGVTEGSTLDCDLCIVGTGAAGITLARELAGEALSVYALEGGGLEYEPSTQALYRGENSGHPYFALESCRLRMFGGTTGHWNGWCRPLDELDLESRDWVPDSGWPLTRAELDPYYARAQPICQLGPYEYGTSYWARATGLPPLAPASVRTSDAVYQYSPPTRFGLTYREELRKARNVTTLLHSNVTGLRLAPDGTRVLSAAVATLGGRRFEVRARRFVLAAGGIENARLMLASNDVRTAGIGNEHDLVGRYFAEHPHAPVALAALPEDLAGGSLYARHEDVQGTAVRAALTTSDAFQRAERLLRFSATLDPVESDPYVDRTSAEERAAEELGDSVVAVQQALEGGPELRLFSLFMRTEQAPNPESRVTLSDRRDRLGMPEARLSWQLSELDRRSITRSVRAFAEALGAAGLGRVYSRPLVEDGFWAGIQGGNHHIGTARMSTDPRRGVVDQHGRVHGVSNLWVAGSAVFPTTGFANPTLTIVALALRLADHLRGRTA